MALFQAISIYGHEPHEWDPNVPGDLKKIRAFFEEKIAKKFRAFLLTKDGGSKQIFKFDEDAERIVLSNLKSGLALAPVGGG